MQRGQQVRAAVLEVIVVRLRQDPFMDFHRELVAETKHESMGRPDELDPHYRSHDRNGGEQAGRRNQHVPVRLGAEGRPVSARSSGNSRARSGSASMARKGTTDARVANSATAPASISASKV